MILLSFSYKIKTLIGKNGRENNSQLGWSSLWHCHRCSFFLHGIRLPVYCTWQLAEAIWNTWYGFIIRALHSTVIRCAGCEWEKNCQTLVLRWMFIFCYMPVPHHTHQTQSFRTLSRGLILVMFLITHLDASNSLPGIVPVYRLAL